MLPAHYGAILTGDTLFVGQERVIVWILKGLKGLSYSRGCFFYEFEVDTVIKRKLFTLFLTINPDMFWILLND